MVSTQLLTDVVVARVAPALLLPVSCSAVSVARVVSTQLLMYLKPALLLGFSLVVFSLKKSSVDVDRLNSLRKSYVDGQRLCFWLVFQLWDLYMAVGFLPLSNFHSFKFFVSYVASFIIF